MSGEDKRNAQQPGELAAAVSGIGIVAVDDIGRGAGALKVVQTLVHKHLHVGPEFGFVQIAPGAEGNPDNVSLVGDLLLELRVVGRHPVIDDLSGDEIDAFHVVPL